MEQILTTGMKGNGARIGFLLGGKKGIGDEVP
jgi:hypothetical protein